MEQALIRELHRRGIRLRLRDGNLDVVAPAGSLTPELRDQLRARRDQLVALLSRADAATGLSEATPQQDQQYQPFPLTDVQHAYWIGRSPAVELGGVSTHYYFELDGKGMDIERLNDSLLAVIGRHDMLRAVVQPDGTQRVLPDVPPYRIETADLAPLSPQARDAELARIRSEMSCQPPPPDAWPLFDIRASLLGGGRHRLHFSFNLLIIDYFSLLLLFADWRRCYADGQRLVPVPISFRDIVLAQESMRDSRSYRKAEQYWLDRLGDLPPPPDLPLARQPRQLDAVEFTRRQGRIERGRWESLKRAARRRGLTPSAVLLTAFADVLRMWSGRQTAFSINLTLFDRPPVHPAIGEVIGDFTSLTMLAIDTSQDETFAARAQRCGAQLMRDLEHIAYSGVRVLRERARRSGSGLGAAMPVVFTSAIGASAMHGGDDRTYFGDLVYGISQTPQVWLDHQVVEEQGDLVLIWDAVDALFPGGLLGDMFAAYLGVLDGLCAGDNAWEQSGPLVTLPSWQAAERARANDTGPAMPARTLCELIEEQARQRAAEPAVLWDSGRLTYGELTAHGYRLARHLAASAGHDELRNNLVGVVLDKGWEQVAAVFGVTRAGAAYLPVDPQWPQARRQQLLEAGRVRTVVTSARLAGELRFPPGIRVVTFADEALRAEQASPPEAGPEPGELAYVIFTSGSTGKPKGVMIDHAAAANTIQDINDRFRIGPQDRVLALSALSFDLSVYDIFGILAAGGAIVMPSPAGVHDPDHWATLMRRHDVTVWDSVPALMRAWADSRAPAGDGPRACDTGPALQDGRAQVPGLRLVLLSGDWIPVELPDAVRELCPGAQVISLGGATEASIWSVCYPIGDVPPSWTRIPYGKPLRGQTLHVYDHRLKPCPVWAVGEIYIGGSGVAQGYWADPQQTAERFITHPATAQRLYRTGDLGRYLPGGDIEFLGREDFQVKLNGYRIELGEISAALRGQAGVADALVQVVTNPETGRRQLAAYVIPDGGPVEPQALRKELESLLPGYLVPHHYLVIDQFPLSANGKVDPAALPSPWENRQGRPPAAPRGPLEEKLVEIWRQELGSENVGVTDNFFDLGADSLHAVRVLGRVREELGFAFDEEDWLQVLFEHPSVGELASALQEQTVTAGPAT